MHLNVAHEPAPTICAIPVVTAITVQKALCLPPKNRSFEPLAHFLSGSWS